VYVEILRYNGTFAQQLNLTSILCLLKIILFSNITTGNNMYKWTT